MVSVVANHQKGAPKYYELATSVRILEGMSPQKVYIRYIGKNYESVDFPGMKKITVEKSVGNDKENKLENLKQKVKGIPGEELFSNESGQHEYDPKNLDDWMQTMKEHGPLSKRHLHWLKETLGKEKPDLNDLDEFYKDKIDSKDAISKAIFKLTSKETEEYFENSIQINKLEEEIEKLSKIQICIADQSGHGGGYDESTGEFFEDKQYDQDSISQSLKSLQRDRDRLNNKNEKFEQKFKKEFDLVKDFLDQDKINEIQLNVNVDVDRLHHINDITDLYLQAKRYKMLQIMKVKFKKENLTDEQRVKFHLINEYLPFNDFGDLQNVYGRTFTFDYASDYIDNKVFNPIALKSWEKGETKKFLHKAFKDGHITREFVKREKGNTHIHYVPNLIDVVNHGKTNIMRRFAGVSKSSMARLINHEKLDYVEKYMIDTLKETRDGALQKYQQAKKDYFSKINKVKTESKKKEIKDAYYKAKRDVAPHIGGMKGIWDTYKKQLIDKGIRNEKELTALYTYIQDKTVRQTSRDILKVVKLQDLYKTADVVKKSAKDTLKLTKTQKKKPEYSKEAEEIITRIKGHIHDEDTEKIVKQIYDNNYSVDQLRTIEQVKDFYPELSTNEMLGIK